ncbi:hypothetical protein QTP88_028585 [Uroleucon formosanum]
MAKPYLSNRMSTTTPSEQISHADCLYYIIVYSHNVYFCFANSTPREECRVGDGSLFLVRPSAVEDDILFADGSSEVPDKQVPDQRKCDHYIPSSYIVSDAVLCCAVLSADGVRCAYRLMLIGKDDDVGRQTVHLYGYGQRRRRR